MAQQEMIFPHIQYRAVYKEAQDNGFNPGKLKAIFDSHLTEPGSLEFWTNTIKGIGRRDMRLVVVARPGELFFLPDPLVADVGHPIVYNGQPVGQVFDWCDSYYSGNQEYINSLIHKLHAMYSQQPSQGEPDLMRMVMPQEPDRGVYPIIPRSYALAFNINHARQGCDIAHGYPGIRRFLQIRDGMRK